MNRFDHANRPPVVGESRRSELPRCQVVLHRDAKLDLMFIVRTVMEMTRFAREEATHKMWQAQHAGSSILLITYRERAELYVELLTGKGLIVTVEPVAT